jgi:DNA polymerase I-like protein with 3'-5' exonuclease and polymerase domains
MMKDLSNAKVICVDIETFDPGISQKLGPGVYRNDGYILGVALADNEGWSTYLNVGHYDCTKKEREENVEYIRKVLALDIPKLGTNILYDVDWLSNWTGNTKTFGFRGEGLLCEVNGLFYDIQTAEALIDENQGQYSLDFQAQKYLGRGKFKDEIQKFCDDNDLKGDARQWLYKMPYKLVHDYAIQDVLEPIEIFRIQWGILHNEELMEVFMLETELLKATLDMRKQGAIIDTRTRDKNAFLATCDKEKRMHHLRSAYGEVNYNSTNQLAELFDKEGVDYKYKLRFTNEKDKVFDKIIGSDDARKFERYKNGDRSDYVVRTVTVLTGNNPDRVLSCNPTINKDFLEGLEQQFDDSDESKSLVGDILFVRKAEKIVGSFLTGSLKDSLCPDGRIHPTINNTKTDDYGTRSGRFSMSNPNLQQIPSKNRDKKYYWGRMCREPFVPLEGCWWGKLDYSQIEYRCLAHFASGEGSRELVQRYNEDPHTDYHQYIVNLTLLSRSYAKNLNFGCMYGMGITHMSEIFNWSDEYAKEIMAIYHGKAPYIKTTMNNVSNVARGRGYIKTIAGRRSRLLDKDKAYIMLNRLLQGSAADIMKKAMVDIYQSGVLDVLTWHITVHDELNFSVPKTAEGVRAFFKVKELMEKAYTLKVPVVAEMEIGSDWAHIKDIGFLDTGINSVEWLANLTDENCVAEVDKLCALVAQIKAA